MILCHMLTVKNIMCLQSLKVIIIIIVNLPDDSVQTTSTVSVAVGVVSLELLVVLITVVDELLDTVLVGVVVVVENCSVYRKQKQKQNV